MPAAVGMASRWSAIPSGCAWMLRGWETPKRAREIYGVVLTGARESDTLAVDREATEEARAALS